MKCPKCNKEMEHYKKMHQIICSTWDGCNGFVDQRIGGMFESEENAKKEANKLQQKNMESRYDVEEVLVPDIFHGSKRIKPTYRAFGKLL